MEHEAREFDAQLIDSREIHELPDGWPAQPLQTLLAALDVENTSDADAMEMAIMALQDLEVDAASDHVLETVFGDGMRPGVRQNLISDLREDRPWEHFAQIAQQADLFEAVVLLQRAFPRDFGKPDAVAIELAIETRSKTAAEWLDAARPDPGLLLRIVAAAMPEHAVLCRLFEAQLAADRFPEASGLVWRTQRREAEEPTRTFGLISSHQWFGALLDCPTTWTAQAWPDQG